MKLEREPEVRSNLKLVVGKEYTLQGFPESRAKVISRVNRPDEFYWVEIISGGRYACYMYHPDGCLSGTSGGDYTLKEIPQTQIHYMNVYRNTSGKLFFYGLDGRKDFYPTKEIADKCALHDRVACIKIVLEEGRFDD